jgi:hypothetical protein
MQGPSAPPQSWYVLDGKLPRQAQNAGLNTAIISNTGLANEFYFAAVESTVGDTVRLTIVSTDYQKATGYLTNFSIDPDNLWNTQVTTCDLNGTPGSEYGYAADVLPNATITSTLAVAAVTAPAADTVHFVGTPASGTGPCVDLGSVTDTLTNTAYGVNVDFTGRSSSPYLLVNSWGSTTNPSGSDGRLSFYSYDFNGALLQAELVNHINGTQLFDMVPVVLDTLCDVPTAGNCLFIVGRPWNTFDDPTVSSVGIITSTATVVSNFEAPGESGFGEPVAVIGDVNGDNKPDVLVGSSERVHVVSGSQFGIPGGAVFTDTLYVVDAPVTGGGFPYSFLVDIDVNGDGKPDWGASAFDADPQGKTDAGMVFLFNGATGSLLYSIPGEQAGEELGGTRKGLVSLGDLAPYDGLSEYIIVAPFHDSQFLLPGGGLITHTGDIRFNASQPPINFKSFKGSLGPLQGFRELLGLASSPQ